MRDPVQEQGEGDFQQDVLGNPRKAPEEQAERTNFQIGATGWKVCLQDKGETERLSKVLEYIKRKVILCKATQDELEVGIWGLPWWRSG